MKENEIEDELVSIRSMMERSSKFISLSGLSGILAGVYALAGAAAGYYLLYCRKPDFLNPYTAGYHPIPDSVDGLRVNYSDQEIIVLLMIPLVVLAASLLTGYVLTKRQAKRKGQAIWGHSSRSLLFHMAVPLLSGGLFIIILLWKGHYGAISAVSLIFYGLSLVSASNFTFSLVKYLGLCEIILGLIAACLPGYGLLFWAIGFGVLHIIYGSLMYLKYDR